MRRAALVLAALAAAYARAEWRAPLYRVASVNATVVDGIDAVTATNIAKAVVRPATNDLWQAKVQTNDFSAATNEIENVKRDKDDLRVYRRAKDCWSWSDWTGSGETHQAPEAFLAHMGSPGTDPIYYEDVAHAWYGAVMLWPDGKRRFGPGEIPPGGYPEGPLATNVNFAMYAYDRDGTTVLYKFGATASRSSATDETLLRWDNTPGLDPNARIATTDRVDREVEERVPLVMDGSGGLTAITVGSRMPGGPSSVGANSATFGGPNRASGASSFAAGTQAAASDPYAFVWQGDSDAGQYSSHGEGTFSVNPLGGLGGFWIGSQSLEEILSTLAPTLPIVQHPGTNRTEVLSQDAATRLVADSVYDATKDALSAHDDRVVSVTTNGAGNLVFRSVVRGNDVGSAIWTGRWWNEAEADPSSTNDIAHGWLVGTEGREAIAAKSVEHWCGDISGSLVYLCDCFSGYDSTLADALIAKGARTVIGHTDTTEANYGDAVMYAFVSRLASTNSAGVRYTAAEALDWATARCGVSDGVHYPVPGKTPSRPVLFGDGGYRLPDGVQVCTVQPFYWEAKERHGDDVLPLPSGVPNNAKLVEAVAELVVASVPDALYAHAMKRQEETDGDRIGGSVLAAIPTNALALFQGHGTWVRPSREEVFEYAGGDCPCCRVPVLRDPDTGFSYTVVAGRGSDGQIVLSLSQDAVVRLIHTPKFAQDGDGLWHEIAAHEDADGLVTVTVGQEGEAGAHAAFSAPDPRTGLWHATSVTKDSSDTYRIELSQEGETHE